MNIDKVTNETEFIIQEKSGGWKGFDIYARHKSFGKFSCEAIVKAKPRLTKELKEKIVTLAQDNKRAEDHNLPLYFEIEKQSKEWSFCVDHISSLFWSNPETLTRAIEIFTQESEDPKINILMQRLRDMDSAREEIIKIGEKKLPKVNRIILGKKE